MELVRTVDKNKIKREKAQQAVDLALDGLWAEARSLNEDILQYFPDDIEAMNRLAKANLELGNLSTAKKNFEKVLYLSPYNSIAKKNLDRLYLLPKRKTTSRNTKKVAPKLLLEKNGRTGITVLRTCASQDILAHVASGDLVTLEVSNESLRVLNSDGITLGYVETKLASRLVKLIGKGNCYDAAVLSATPAKVSVVIREIYRHPSLLGVISFPAVSKEEYPSGINNVLLRYEIEKESDDEDDDDTLEISWAEDVINDDDGGDMSDNLRGHSIVIPFQEEDID
ncbi:uncharacterized protein METZ01_LOCUS188032 [marine metagenome]|uniref:Uncharacterized protein n=1 Tax=marine metagenome TaxID=408172 RepID=A0A382D9R0_9ZZZZ